MSPDEIRLECLKLAVPRDIANPDEAAIIKRASAYEAYVHGEGQAEKSAPSNNRLTLPSQQTGQPGVAQPRRK